VGRPPDQSAAPERLSLGVDEPAGTTGSRVTPHVKSRIVYVLENSRHCRVKEMGPINRKFGLVAYLEIAAVCTSFATKRGLDAHFKATLMTRLLAFAPALIVFLGAVLVAGGSFWAAFRQSAFNAAIAEKNEEIATLQQKNIRTLKGSDFFHFMVALQQNSKGEFRLMSVNRTDLPVYDVYLIIRSHVDLPWDTPEHQAQALHYLQNPMQVDVGTIPTGAKEIMWLEPGYYQIDIRTRYAKYTEMIKFGVHENSPG
jgi:hypothetical protein